LYLLAADFFHNPSFMFYAAPSNVQIVLALKSAKCS